MESPIPEPDRPNLTAEGPSRVEPASEEIPSPPVSAVEHAALSLAAGKLDLWDWDVNSGILLVGERSARLVGRTAEEFAALGSSWYEIIHPDDRRSLWAAIKAHFKGEAPFISGEYRASHKDGRWVWLLTQGNVVERDRDGRATRVMGFDVDVSDRKRAETAVLFQKELALALSATSNLDEALELCVDTALRIAGLDAMGIYLPDEHSNLHLVAHRGVSEEFVRASLFMPAEYPETQTIFQGLPRYLHTRDATPPINAVLEAEGLQGIASIPIAYRGTVIASFTLASRTLEEIPSSIRHLLEALASQIGAAITRIRAENSLKESEERFRTFAEGLPQVVFEMDNRSNFLFLNRAGLELGGFTPEDLKRGLRALDIIAPEHLERGRTNIAKVLAGERTDPIEYQAFRKDGSRASIVVYSSPVVRDGKPVGLRGLCVDVTPLKEAQERLTEALEEKEILLRELHHRVKNNLQVIQSLLHLQARQVRDDAFLEMVRETEYRISAMALLHEHYCRSDSLADLDMTAYVSRIVDYLVASKFRSGNPISVEKEIQVIHLSVDTAMHVGMLLTELIITCLKHAFSQGQQGGIRISLRAMTEDRYELVVGHNGEGVKANGVDGMKSAGLSLIETMLRQVDGTMEIVHNGGTECRITFRDVHRPRT